MNQQTKYALGFMFSPEGDQVVLIHKQKPDWLAGLMSGVGGHQEEGESPLECMVREFEEETGVKTEPADWTYFHTVDIPTAIMPCYYMRSPLYKKVRTVTDERISIAPVATLSVAAMAPRTMGLIATAIQHFPD